MYSVLKKNLYYPAKDVKPIQFKRLQNLIANMTVNFVAELNNIQLKDFFFLIKQNDFLPFLCCIFKAEGNFLEFCIFI